MVCGGVELKLNALQNIGEAVKFDNVLISAISAWEIGMLSAKGRLQVAGSAEQYVSALFSRTGVVEEPLTAAIGELAARLPGVVHGDPADRILIATAAVRSATVLTRDERIRNYARRTRLVTVVTV